MQTKSRPTPQKKLMFDRKKRQWKYVVIPHNRTLFGETNYQTHKIGINKQLSKKAARVKKGVYKKFGMTKKDTSEINSIVHERDHALHPRSKGKGWLESTVRRRARSQVAKMSKKQKSKLYKKVK